MADTRTAMQQLELVREAEDLDILRGELDPELGASGVLAKAAYVIFDNLPHIACIGPRITRATRDNLNIMQGKGTDAASRTSRTIPNPADYVLIERWPRPREVHGRGAGIRRSLLLYRQLLAGLPALTGRTRAWKA